MTKRLSLPLTLNSTYSHGRGLTKRRRNTPEPIVRTYSSDAASQSSSVQSVSPQEALAEAYGVKGLDVRVRSWKSIKETLFFEQKEEKDIFLRQKAMDAVRRGDVKTLHGIFSTGHSLQCSNKYGESLLHFACRKGNVEVIKFLINQAQESLLLCDDFGRTPMHEAFWTPEPNFEVVEMLARHAPELFLVSDSRGHTPLEYAPRRHWKEWVDFIKCRGYLFVLENESQLTFDFCNDQEEEDESLEDAMLMLRAC